MKDWTRFYDATAARPPRSTLLRALEVLQSEKSAQFAVDLGCGAGRDTVELLRRRWKVLALDGEPEALRRLEARGDLPGSADLDLRHVRFEDDGFTIPPCDLVNASFSIPFVPPEVFRRLWSQICTAVRPGGCFAGQLLGARDTWADRESVTSFDRAGALALCDGWEVVVFEESEEDSTTVRGTAKHWHLFHLVLRKPGHAAAADGRAPA